MMMEITQIEAPWQTLQTAVHGNLRPAGDCLLILTLAMTGVTVDPANLTARVEAGVQRGAVLHAAQEHDLTPLFDPAHVAEDMLRLDFMWRWKTAQLPRDDQASQLSQASHLWRGAPPR